MPRATTVNAQRQKIHTNDHLCYANGRQKAPQAKFYKPTLVESLYEERHLKELSAGESGGMLPQKFNDTGWIHNPP